jgi:NAD(P)-dependent dehydrogenase (short-subunit alcohol dehydrogenase family)
VPVAVITGASLGLGRALAHGLADRGWSLVLDARHPDPLRLAAAALPGGPHRVLPGDVTDAGHLAELVAAAEDLGGADLLVNNASTLGASPLPRLADLDPATYLRILEVDVVAPVALAAALLPQLRARRGRILNISSDAAVEAYETWGGYGSAKAALDQASRVLAAEEPDVRVHAVDPGDMRTAMHQDAYPGEDISDRPLPESVVPGLLELVEGDHPSGRYRAAELTPVSS